MGRQGRGIWKVAASLVVLGAAGYGVLTWGTDVPVDVVGAAWCA